MPIPYIGVTEFQRHRYHAPVPKGWQADDFKRLKLITLHQWLPNCDLKKFRRFTRGYV
jgi:hypothetical protein